MVLELSIYNPEHAATVIGQLPVNRLENMIRLLERAPNGDPAIPAMVTQIKAEISDRKLRAFIEDFRDETLKAMDFCSDDHCLGKVLDSDLPELFKAIDALAERIFKRA